MQRLGALKNAKKSMILTLQQAQHFVSTAFGRSSNSYGTQMAEPMQGIGQGNGCGLAAWLAVRVPIIEMMRTAGYGFNLLTALSCTLISFVCYAFVDDTDIICTATEVTTSGKEVADAMQKAIYT